MKIIYLTFLASVALVAPIHAESLEEHFGVGPGQLTAANVANITGYSTIQAAISAYLCSEDMARRDKEVRADHDAYNKHLAEWLQKNKDADNARRLAEAAAAQAQIEAREKAIQNAATISVINANNAYTNWMNSH